MRKVAFVVTYGTITKNFVTNVNHQLEKLTHEWVLDNVDT